MKPVAHPAALVLRSRSASPPRASRVLPAPLVAASSRRSRFGAATEEQIEELDISAPAVPPLQEEVIHLDYEGVALSSQDPPSPPSRPPLRSHPLPPARPVLPVLSPRRSSASDPPEAPAPYRIPRRAAGRRGSHRRQPRLNSAICKPPPSEIRVKAAWARSAEAKVKRYYPGIFKSDFDCPVCPSVLCQREDNFLKHLKSNKHRARVFALTPKYCHACPAGPFHTRGLWNDHLASR